MSDSDDFTEIQVGGGGHSNATPSPVLTPTRLCTAIKATDHDGGLISKSQICRTQQSVSSTLIAEKPHLPIKDNLSLAEPKIRCALELFQSAEGSVLDYLQTPSRYSPAACGMVDCQSDD